MKPTSRVRPAPSEMSRTSNLKNNILLTKSISPQQTPLCNLSLPLCECACVSHQPSSQQFEAYHLTIQRYQKQQRHHPTSFLQLHSSFKSLEMKVKALAALRSKLLNPCRKFLQIFKFRLKRPVFIRASISSSPCEIQ